MDGQDRQHFVQQYVERQKAYIPAYTAEDLINRSTPPKLPRTNLEFGFDTPVLRPRALLRELATPQPTALHTRQKKRGAEHSGKKQTRSSPDARCPASTQRMQDRPRHKRKNASTPIDTDDERAARLAGRRERKRKKRAIVNPSQDDDVEIVRTVRPKKGKTNKPAAALALMYGFSATNVTKDRLTLKPAFSRGVFSKGRASAKKNITATKRSCEYFPVAVKKAVLKHSASRNELFSESAFLNETNERTADPDSDGSTTLDHSMPRESRVANRTKKDRGKCTELLAFAKTSQEPARTGGGSEVWDIEIQSNLPSSACDVPSEPGTRGSVPVVLDLRGAEWSAPINMSQGHERCGSTARIPSLSVAQSRSRTGSIVCSPLLARMNLDDEAQSRHAADVSSLHPSYSASQVGYRAAGAQASDPRLVSSKYFIDSKPVSVSRSIANPPPTIRPSDDIDDRDAEVDVPPICPVTSPISIPGITEFRTRYGMVPREFTSNDCPCEACWRGMNVPSELAEGPEQGHFECSVVEMEDERFISGETDWGGDMWNRSVGEYEDMLVSECEDDVEEVELAAGGDEDRSICWSEEGGADFLEGRALLHGSASARCVGMTGLDEAERDVASRLGFYHWRPLRL